MMNNHRGGVPSLFNRYQIWQKEANANRVNLFSLSLDANKERGGLQKDRIFPLQTLERGFEV